MSRAAAWLGWAALGVAAALGVGLSLVALLAAAPFARPFVAGRVVSLLDEAIAGRLELDGIEVLSRGGIELRGLEVFDPHGHLVLSAERARAFADVTSLRRRAVGLSLEIESPSVLIEEEQGGGVSLARAFAPARPKAERAPGERVSGPGWTVHLSRVQIRGGDVWWVDAENETRLEATGVDVDGRGLYGPERVRVDLRVRGVFAEPVEAPFALELAGGITDGAVRVPALRAELGETALAAVGVGHLRARTARIAVTRLDAGREVARALEPRAPEGDDLLAVGYLESDGSVVSAAVRAEPVEEGARGHADAAVAARLGALGDGLGFDVVLDRLDPARLVAAAPRGEVTLAARGALAGRSARALRGHVAATVRESRLREGTLSRAEVVARADRGALEVSRAVASGPGLSVEGALRWRRGGPVSGRIAADATDLRLATRNLAALLGRGLPPLAGRARVAATLEGTSEAPAASGTVDAPALRVGGLSVEGARLSVRAAGPLGALTGAVEGTVAAVSAGGPDLGRDVVLRGAVADEAGSLALTANVPGFRDAASFEARGRLAPGRDALIVSTLALAYPGARWTLEAPATVALAGPRVDALRLASGEQRISLAGGLGRRGALDARAELVRLDLARLPAGLVPESAGLRGELTAEVRATGTTSRPELAASGSVASGAFRNLRGLDAVVAARLDGGARRLAGSVALSRGEGGTVDAQVDVPLPLAARPGERISARVKVAGVPLEEALAAAGIEPPVAGDVLLDLAVDGSAGAPTARASATLSDGAWRDLDALALDLAVEAAGERLRVRAGIGHEGRRVAAADVRAPLDVPGLLARPGVALRRLRTAPLEGSVTITGLELASLAGCAGLPPDVAGAVSGAATLAGTVAAPRGRLALEVERGAIAGYGAIAATLEATLGAGAVTASGRATVAGDEALRFEGSLGAAPERLLVAEGLRSAPLRLDARVPGLALERAAAEAPPLTGTVEARLAATGTLGAPEVTLAAGGESIAVSGRPLGAARLDARYAPGRGTAELLLRPEAGGTLRATLGVAVALGVGAEGVPLGEAPAELAATAEALDLGFLAAVAPTVVRSAAGTIAMDLRAEGPLARLIPRGTLRVADARVAVAEYGEYTGIALEAAVGDDAIEVPRLELHRGSGRLTASGSLRGLRTDGARLEARVAAEGLTVSRAGMDLVTLDLEARAAGSYADRALSVDITVPGGVVRLPRRPPRTLQSLERREDIVVGEREQRRRVRAALAAAAPAAPADRPLSLTARVVVPRNLFVKSEDPRIDVELKADVRYERAGGEDFAQGSIEAVRGIVEPIGGRIFVLERGRVQFTGGPPSAAMLDVEARYENPAAVVTVRVQGPTSSPEIQLSSQPPMDDAQIAMLIATGRTELKAGTGGVGTLTGEEAGRAALGVLATQAFKNLISDKLPLDTVALDGGALRAGKYVTDEIYVGYVRRFDADPERGENVDEVRVQYQITPRWSFESRYGSAQSGGAHLIWSKDY